MSVSNLSFIHYSSVCIFVLSVSILKKSHGKNNSRTSFTYEKSRKDEKQKNYVKKITRNSSKIMRDVL